MRALVDSRREATTDPLTGLANRRRFESEHARMLLGDGGAPAVLLCDLDHFKLLNDTHGHEAGDTALVVFADLLREVLRPQDLLARIGGEEFAVLLPKTDAEAAMIVANRVRAAVAEQAREPDPPGTTVSIGVAPAGEGPALADQLRAADAALYAAKAAGRDIVVLAGSHVGAEPMDVAGPDHAG